MPVSQSFNRRAQRAGPGRGETSYGQSGDSFTPRNYRNRRHSIHTPIHESYRRTPRPARRHNNGHRSRASSSDEAGIRQYQDTLHPAVIYLYKSIKASTVRLKMELENLTAGIDKIAPGEDHMEWKQGAGTIIYVPTDRNPTNSLGGAGTVKPNDVAPALPYPHPHHTMDLEHGHALYNTRVETVTESVTPQPDSTNFTTHPQQNQTATPFGFPLPPSNTTFPIHQLKPDPNQHSQHSQPSQPNPSGKQAHVHFPSGPSHDTISTAPTVPSTDTTNLPPPLKSALDLLRALYDNSTRPATHPQPTQTPPTPAPSPFSQSDAKPHPTASEIASLRDLGETVRELARRNNETH